MIKCYSYSGDISYKTDFQEWYTAVYIETSRDMLEFRCARLLDAMQSYKKQPGGEVEFSIDRDSCIVSIPMEEFGKPSIAFVVRVRLWPVVEIDDDGYEDITHISPDYWLIHDKLEAAVREVFSRRGWDIFSLYTFRCIPNEGIFDVSFPSLRFIAWYGEDCQDSVDGCMDAINEAIKAVGNDVCGVSFFRFEDDEKFKDTPKGLSFHETSMHSVSLDDIPPITPKGCTYKKKFMTATLSINTNEYAFDDSIRFYLLEADQLYNAIRGCLHDAFGDKTALEMIEINPGLSFQDWMGKQEFQTRRQQFF